MDQVMIISNCELVQIFIGRIDERAYIMETMRYFLANKANQRDKSDSPYCLNQITNTNKFKN